MKAPKQTASFRSLLVCGLVWSLVFTAPAPAGDPPAQEPPPPPKADAPETDETPDAQGNPKKVDQPPKVPAAEVTSRARSLANACLCKGCNGKGKVVKEGSKPKGDTKGQNKDGPVFRDREKTFKEKPCTICSATGLASESAINKASINLLRALDRVNLKDPQLGERYEAAAKLLSEATTSVKGWAQRINPPALERLNGMNPKKGEHILLVGRLDVIRDHNGTREHVITIGPNKTIRLPNARLYKGAKDQIVLVGGTLREVNVHDGRLDVEIEGGFVMETSEPEQEWL